MDMVSRERVKRAIHFEGPDRLPHYLPDGGPNDILWLWIPRPPERQAWRPHGNHERRIDEWGVTWERSEGQSVGEAIEWPIADITQQAKYVLPDLNHPRYYMEARAAIEASNRELNPLYCLGVMPFSSLNEGTHNIMGLQRMFLAYYEQPEHLKALLARMAAAQRESIVRLARCGCDGIMAYDDWGLQDRLMVSLDLVIEFFLPHYRANWRSAHELGMDVWMHSCGNTLELLPALIDAGLDVIQLDQQENMGLDNLDRVAGGKLAFWCPVDIQQTMVRGTPEDVRHYVQRMTATLGGHNGGLISMAYSSPKAVNHSGENTAAMCQAFRETALHPPASNLRPHIVAIAGASCSGKSTIARALAAALPGDAAVIPMDAYYHDLAHLTLADRAHFNFDAPDALEYERLLDHLRALKRGQPIDIPEYDYTMHTRTRTTRHIAPGRWLILEGIHAFYWESIRALLDTKVFLETPPGLCLERRIERDTRERGRTEASVREQFAATVQPMYHLYCAPAARFADFAIPGDGPIEDAVAKIAAAVESLV